MVCATDLSSAWTSIAPWKPRRSWIWWTRSFTANSRPSPRDGRAEEGPANHRRRLHRESGTGRLGVHPAPWRKETRDVGIGAAYHQQSHGADGGGAGVGGVERAV